MDVREQSSYSLRDKAGLELGTVAITALTPTWVKGRFTPSAGFAGVRGIFEEFEQLVNDQIFALVDEAAAKIDDLGMQLYTSDGDRCVPIFDVQLMNGHDIAFKLHA